MEAMLKGYADHDMQLLKKIKQYSKCKCLLI